MAYKHIQTELKDGVAYLTLNRAPLNVLNIEMMGEINAYFESLLKEKSLRLLVVQAVGKLFSAGAAVRTVAEACVPAFVEAWPEER